MSGEPNEPKQRMRVTNYADNLEQRIEQMEEVIKEAAERKLQTLDAIPEVGLHSRRQKEDSEPKLLSNRFEEFDVFDTTQWPAGVA